MRRVINGGQRRVAAVLCFIGFAWLSGGCASTMMVFTEPGDAEIVVQGELIGRSPVLYAGHSSLDGTVQVTARLPGYQETTVDVSREPSIAHLAEAVLFPPLLAVGWYLPDSISIELKPLQQ